METSNYTTYDKPYPTIGDLIKGKDYDCISYRIAYPGCDEEHGTFAGYFSAKNGEIIPLDGDIYELNEEVIESEEWTIPEEEIQNGLMTYKEASRDVVIPGGHVYDIGFYDGDERQFVAFGSRDLEQLWNDFCDKNNLERDCIDYIELV